VSTPLGKGFNKEDKVDHMIQTTVAYAGVGTIVCIQAKWPIRPEFIPVSEA